KTPSAVRQCVGSPSPRTSGPRVAWMLTGWPGRHTVLMDGGSSAATVIAPSCPTSASSRTASSDVGRETQPAVGELDLRPHANAGTQLVAGADAHTVTDHGAVQHGVGTDPREPADGRGQDARAFTDRRAVEDD